MNVCPIHYSYNTVHVGVCYRVSLKMEVHLHTSVYISFQRSVSGPSMPSRCLYKIASTTIFTSNNLVYTGCLCKDSWVVPIFSHTCRVIYTLQATIAVKGILLM